MIEKNELQDIEATQKHNMEKLLFEANLDQNSSDILSGLENHEYVETYDETIDNELYDNEYISETFLIQDETDNKIHKTHVKVETPKQKSFIWNENISSAQNIDLHKKLVIESDNESYVQHELFNNTMSEATTKNNETVIEFHETHTQVQDNTIMSVHDLETLKKKESSPLQKAWKTFTFLCRYTISASLIFVVLITLTNYSAYITIAKSYLAPESIKKSEVKMTQSLESAKIESKNELQKKNIIKSDETSEKQDTLDLWEKPKTYVNDIRDIMGDIESEDVDLWIEVIPFVNRLIIPKIAKNIPLIDIEKWNVENFNELNNIFMDELKWWVVRYPGSAKPGQKWNAFIFGHSSNFPWMPGSYNDVFALLDRLEIWDEVISYYKGHKYTYKIKEKKVINPNDVSVLKRDTGKKELTLMTCWPIGTTYNRLLVIWELIEQ